MTSLLDIGPMTEEVKIGDKSVTVRGVTPEGFFYLLSKFPTLRTLLGGGAARKDLSMIEVQAVAPGCIAHALAIATLDRSTYAGVDAWTKAIEDSAAVAVNLSAHYQISIFQSALRLTFPEGVGPFMKAVETLGAAITKVSGTDPVTTSSKPSRSGFVTDSRGMRLGKAAPSKNLPH